MLGLEAGALQLVKEAEGIAVGNRAVMVGPPQGWPPSLPGEGRPLLETARRVRVRCLPGGSGSGSASGEWGRGLRPLGLLLPGHCGLASVLTHSTADPGPHCGYRSPLDLVAASLSCPEGQQQQAGVP